MTFNPDAPLPSERHPELYERMCNARAFIEQVLAAHVKARKANGMTRPNPSDFQWIQEGLNENDIWSELCITSDDCTWTIGEDLLLNIEELQKIIEENWK